VTQLRITLLLQVVVFNAQVAFSLYLLVLLIHTCRWHCDIQAVVELTQTIMDEPLVLQIRLIILSYHSMRAQ